MARLLSVGCTSIVGAVAVVAVAVAVVAAGCGRSGAEPAGARKRHAPSSADAATDTAADGAPGAVAAGGRRFCTAGAVGRARRAAEERVKRGEYEAAARELDRSLAGCDVDSGDAGSPNLDYFWIQSDRAFLAYKAKDYVGCLRVLAPLVTPRPPFGIHALHLERSAVGRAILHNEELCRSASPDQRAEFQSPPCPLAGGKDETAIGLPADALPRGAGVGCLVLEASAGPDAFRRSIEGGDDAATRLCGELVLRTGQPGAQATAETRLVATDGPLEDTSVCCNLDKVSFSGIGGARQVRVQGRGLDCAGGTADTELDAVYTWQGDRLRLDEDDAVGSH
jgi:hypothetical protein